MPRDDLMYLLQDDVGDRASSCKFGTSKPVVPLSIAKLCLRNSVIEDNVLDSVSSAFASSSLHEMEEDDAGAFFDSVAGACDAVHDA